MDFASLRRTKTEIPLNAASWGPTEREFWGQGVHLLLKQRRMGTLSLTGKGFSPSLGTKEEEEEGGKERGWGEGRKREEEEGVGEKEEEVRGDPKSTSGGQ